MDVTFMPFYRDNEPELMTSELKREVACLREIIASIHLSRKE